MIGSAVVVAARTLLLVALALPESRPPSYRGFGASYGKGVMEQVARNREMPRSGCMVASFRLPLGRWVRVVGQRTGVMRRCQVIDICAPQDCPTIRARKIVIELDWESNRAICGFSREPPRMCPVSVWELGP